MSLLAKVTQHKAISATIGSFAVAASLYYTMQFTRPASTLAEKKFAFKGDDKWIDLKLLKYEDLSSDTRRFVFALPSEDESSGLVTSSLLLAKYMTPKGNPVIRPYTPTSDHDTKGSIEFVIKKYPTGKFGNYIFGLKENDTVSFKGPIVKWKWTPNQFENVTLIGGGSGITPLYQLLHHITADPEDKTKLHLVYGSKTVQDILLRKEIDQIAAKYPDRVKVSYFLDKEDSSIKAESGYISAKWLKENIPAADASHQVFVCGPPGLNEAVSGNKVSPTDQGELTGALKELGFTKENVFKF